MGWERRPGGPSGGYYYRSVRRGGRVVKVYMGRGAAGHEAAADVARRKQARLAARAAVRAEREQTAEADRLAAGLHAWAGVLSTCRLTAAGFRNHRGEWRRPVNAKKKPRVGSRAWEAALADDEGYARTVVASLAKRAAAGDKEAADNLAWWVEKHPGLQTTIAWLGDLDTAPCRLG